jgi:hypothetical protein
MPFSMISLRTFILPFPTSIHCFHSPTRVAGHEMAIQAGRIQLPRSHEATQKDFEPCEKNRQLQIDIYIARTPVYNKIRCSLRAAGCYLCGYFCRESAGPSAGHFEGVVRTLLSSTTINALRHA